MFKLTPEQSEALAAGKSLTFIDPRTHIVYGLECVGEYDDSELTADDLQALLARSFETNGWADPEMDVYDNYDEEWAKRCQ